MDPRDAPGNPISSLLDNTIVQIGIIVVSVLVVLVTDNANRRLDLLNLSMYLILPVIVLIAVAMLMDGFVWLVCLLSGIRLSKKQFARYFFAIYSLLIFLQLLTSLIQTLAR